MLNLLLTVLTLLALTSCGSGNLKGGGPDANQTGGSEQYILPDTPAWANFSSVGECFRQSNVHYMDFSKMNASFGMDYKKLVEFQILFNRSYADKLDEVSSSYLSPSMENKLFDEVYGKINNGVKPIELPKFDRIHLIWIDSALGSANEKAKIDRLVKSPLMEKGFPIFLSTCLTETQIEQLVQKHEWVLPGYKTLGAESFAVYNTLYQKTPYFGLNFSKLLGVGKWIYLFAPTPIVPKQFQGELIIRTF
jgi:hypothetical protein